MAGEKQLEWDYTNARSLGNTTQELEQLVRVVRPDTAGMKERGGMGTVTGKQAF